MFCDAALAAMCADLLVTMFRKYPELNDPALYVDQPLESLFIERDERVWPQLGVYKVGEFPVHSFVRCADGKLDKIKQQLCATLAKLKTRGTGLVVGTVRLHAILTENQTIRLMLLGVEARKDNWHGTGR